MNINLEKLNWEATKSLLSYDQKNIGTKKYLGMSYWWHHQTAYKHALRELNPSQNKTLHDHLIANGVDVIGANNYDRYNKEWVYERYLDYSEESEELINAFICKPSIKKYLKRRFG